MADYERSSKETIAAGTQFSYRDHSTAQWRIGYYDRVTGRVTAVSDDNRDIVSHVRCTERYVEGLSGSGYT